MQENADGLPTVGQPGRGFQDKLFGFLSQTVKLLQNMADRNKTKEAVINEHHSHFREVIKEHLKLPITDPNQVEVLNNALLDIKLSISLVGLFRC